MGVIELVGLWIYGFHQIQKHLSNCLQIVVLPPTGHVRQHPVGCQAWGARRSPGLCELQESFVSHSWVVCSRACGSCSAGDSPRSLCGYLARPPQPLCPCASPFFVTFWPLNSSCLDFPRLTFFLISSLRLPDSASDSSPRSAPGSGLGKARLLEGSSGSCPFCQGPSLHCRSPPVCKPWSHVHFTVRLLETGANPVCLSLLGSSAGEEVPVALGDGQFAHSSGM